MRVRSGIDIPSFLEQRPSASYNPAGRTARAVFLRDVATAWRKAGDQDTAAKIQRDADNQVQRSISADVA